MKQFKSVLISLALSCLAAEAAYDKFLFGPATPADPWPSSAMSSDTAGNELKNYPSVQDKFNDLLLDLYCNKVGEAGSKEYFGLIDRWRADLALCRRFLPDNQALAQSLRLRLFLALTMARQFRQAREVGTEILSVESLIKSEQKAEKQLVVPFSLDDLQALVNVLRRRGLGADAEILEQALVKFENAPGVRGKEVMVNAPQLAAEKLYQEGLAALGDGRYEEAELKLKESLRLFESNTDENLVLSRGYDNRVALSETLVALDRHDEAVQHLDRAIDNLRRLPRHSRPQTADILSRQLALIDRKLNNTSAAGGERSLLASLMAVAYIYKIDGKLNEAAHQFRRAYLLADGRAEENQDLLFSIAYDLGETLYWSGMFDESRFYLEKALSLQETVKRGAGLNVRSVLGRVLISQGRGADSYDFYLTTMRHLAAEINRADNSALELPALLELLSLPPERLGTAFRVACDDALQGMADASISLKRYDHAIASDIALLKLRQSLLPPHKDQITATWWQMAWVYQNMYDFEKSAYYYDLLASTYPQDRPRPLADWYHGQALALDLMGRDEAAAVFRKAVVLFKEQLQVEKDLEQADRLTWLVDDLENILKTREKSPPDRRDYLRAEPTYYWKAERFPLKVFIEPGRDNGFSGELRELLVKSIAPWTTFAGTPASIRYVDSIDEADVYVERVVSYDDIPYSSAGRTACTFEWVDGKETRVIDRAHVRIYSQSADGVSLSSFAKTHLETLFAHEFGHVLGLGHSPGGKDLMYWKSCSLSLTARDQETLRELYRQAHKRL